MHISKVTSSPNALPQTKQPSRAEETPEARSRKVAEKVKGEKTTLQAHSQPKQSSHPVEESKQPPAGEDQEKQKGNGGIDTLA